ncbi:MAG: UbiA family prenyltransferase [Polyangiaceae bacterium]
MSGTLPQELGDPAPATSASPLATFASVSRIHIIAIAMLGTLTFGWLFTGRYPTFLTFVVGFDWFVVNLLNRVVDLDEDRTNGIRGTDFVDRHRRGLSWLGFGTLAVSFVAVHLVAPAVTPFRVAYQCLGLAYNWPILPGRRRIKALYFWKNTASATGFLLTVFAYPLADAGAFSSPAAFASVMPRGVSFATIAVSAVFFFLFELSFEVLYDLRDAPGDAAANVRTYPVVHGHRAAVRIVDALLVTSSLTLLVGYASGVVPWRIVVMVAAPAVQAVAAKRALRRGITSADCIGITWIGAALLAIYHVWILLRLPGIGL